VDAGWTHWLPTVLQDILAALDASETRRRKAFGALAAAPDPLALIEWERFRMVAPSRLDVPALPSELDAEEALALLEGLGLADSEPPRRVAHPDPVETVLTLEHEDVRELERLRAAIEPGAIETAVEALPDLGTQFGGAKVGRNDPCPCGSGRKFKKCHGA
jgi:hypothetical protein